MLNNMVASFTASNQIGEAMKKANQKTGKRQRSRLVFFPSVSKPTVLLKTKVRPLCVSTMK